MTLYKLPLFFIAFTLLAQSCSNTNSPKPATAAKDSTISTQKDSTILTVAKLHTLKATSNNPSGDYYLGTPEEQKKLVQEFVSDNSKTDAVALYIAAGTALRLQMIPEAGFLYYAAQLRKHFDYGRFGLGEANGSNVQTYLSYLNQTEGAPINSVILKNPEAFTKALNMINTWNTIPADDADYPKSLYSTYAIPQEKWQAIADTDKKSFLDEFAYVYLKIMKDPKGLEALTFIDDYSSGKIEKSAESDKKMEAYKKILQQFQK